MSSESVSNGPLKQSSDVNPSSGDSKETTWLGRDITNLSGSLSEAEKKVDLPKAARRPVPTPRTFHQDPVKKPPMPLPRSKQTANDPLPDPHRERKPKSRLEPEGRKGPPNQPPPPVPQKPSQSKSIQQPHVTENDGDWVDLGLPLDDPTPLPVAGAVNKHTADAMKGRQDVQELEKKEPDMHVLNLKSRKEEKSSSLLFRLFKRSPIQQAEIQVTTVDQGMGALQKKIGSSTLMQFFKDHFGRTDLGTEGIFRKGGTIGLQKELLTNALAQSNAELLKTENIHNVTGLFKSFIKHAEIFSSEEQSAINDLFKAYGEQEHRKQELKKIIAQMSPEKRELLKDLLDIMEKTSVLQDSNKMEPSNLAIVIGPNLFAGLMDDQMPAEKMFQKVGEVNGVTQFLIENCRELFPATS